MEHLSDAVLDYLWFPNFSDEEAADPRLTLKLMESLVHRVENDFSHEERKALMDSARRRLATLLRGADEYGYTHRSLLTDEKREFLEGIAAGLFSGNGSRLPEE